MAHKKEGRDCYNVAERHTGTTNYLYNILLCVYIYIYIYILFLLDLLKISTAIWKSKTNTKRTVNIKGKN